MGMESAVSIFGLLVSNWQEEHNHLLSLLNRVLVSASRDIFVHPRPEMREKKTENKEIRLQRSETEMFL